MSSELAVRAWKDPHFREELSIDARAALPEHPAGTMENADALFADITGQCAGGEGITQKGCLDMLSEMFSCVACQSTVWHGTCGALTIGCCTQPT